jgi:hypothetical protein
MKKTLLALAAAFVAVGAQAASVSFSDSIATTTTNWNDNLTLSKFDSSLGNLTSIVFSYSGSVTSTFRGESLDAAPATVALNANAALNFGVPIGGALTISGSDSRSLSAFDGSIDFGGTSGFDAVVVTGSDSDILTLLSGFGAFTGVGTYDISVGAVGNSNATGAGNLLAQINTVADAAITVTYNYDTPTVNVPEPSALALVGLALAGLGVASRRRKA